LVALVLWEELADLLERLTEQRKALRLPRPVVSGTDIKVSQIASEAEHLGMTPDEIVEAHPHLSLADVHAALAYYYDHQAAIQRDWQDARTVIASLRDRFPRRPLASDR
jgi:uncharacterized protein (DUF433 family)